MSAIKPKGIIQILLGSRRLNVLNARVRRIAANAALQVLLGFAIASLLLAAPWWLLSLGLFDGMKPNEVGDYLGGIAGFVSSTITVILVYLVWVSERKDDRKTTFYSSLMTLLQIHVAERQRLLDKYTVAGFFQRFWQSNVTRLLSEHQESARRSVANRVYDEHYDDVASWFLSVLRVLRYIEDSGQSENEKHEAMKLFRLFCEREEQRALFLLLFTKDSTAESPKLLLKHSFFKYAGFKEDSRLSALWEQRLEGWS